MTLRIVITRHVPWHPLGVAQTKNSQRIAGEPKDTSLCFLAADRKAAIRNCIGHLICALRTVCDFPVFTERLPFPVFHTLFSGAYLLSLG